MTNEKDYIYHPEEIENAQMEKRAALVSQLFTAHHLNHEIPLGAIVEIELEKTLSTGLILKGKGNMYVVGHTRDCDGTPLYWIGDKPVGVPYEAETAFSQLRLLYDKIVFVEGPYSELKQTGMCDKFYSSLQEYFNAE